MCSKSLELQRVVLSVDVHLEPDGFCGLDYPLAPQLGIFGGASLHLANIEVMVSSAQHPSIGGGNPLQHNEPKMTDLACY
jgi:hypothetical protein